ncbi:MAG: (deoxy)nucleoside triphosphate pyrophosphohydrolase [Bacteroidales bacterium]|nr:(deoxy)nucleoside triphosphate pyrophosphohydrolase [Bacteroidales bacterium]
MKTVHVVAALIVHDGRIFATQRGYGEWKGYWEYPGGKVEPGETPQEALVREIREELATEIEVERHVTTVEWDYPAFHLSMRCYLCSVVSGTLTLLEHEAAAWLDRGHLRSVNWLPADEGILDQIESLL